MLIFIDYISIFNTLFIMYDVAIIGGGISGMSCALRLQAKGLSTIVLEAHGQLGGCAGFFTKQQFSFDVGATTLVDFQANGIGGLFCNEVGIDLPQGEYIDYVAWLPDRKVILYHDQQKWMKERAEKFGNDSNYQAFWKLLDKVSAVFWNASRKGIILPFANLPDIIHAVKCIGIGHLHLAKYLNTTMLDVLKKFHLQDDAAIKGFLSMLIEDTLHTTLEQAPFINAALGVTIRGSGLMRPYGGMRSYFSYIEAHYKNIGGTVKKAHAVTNITRDHHWNITSSKGPFSARKLITTLPLENVYQIGSPVIQTKLEKYKNKGTDLHGGAIVVFLGVPEENVSGQAITHHQLLSSYSHPLGNGNNMFISVSSSGDTSSAPAGFRAVMISTHCSIQEWINLSEAEYLEKKKAIADLLITNAKKVYPSLMDDHRIYEIGTPLTYQKYTRRNMGAVGGHKLSMNNANLKSIPHNIGVKDFWMAGDSTWPGLGTVAAVMVSKIVCDKVVSSF